jgi:YD repeat-containing protein
MKTRTCAPIDPTVSSVLADANTWIYSGQDPLQSGVAPGTIVRAHAALAKGLVLTREGFPLSGATVSVASHPEFGNTVTQTNGEFEMVVNGGEVLAFRIEHQGFFGADRSVDLRWGAYAQVPDVILIQADPTVTSVALGGSDGDFSSVQGLKVEDSSGARQPTVLVPADTAATMMFPDGSPQPLNQLHIRVTEYTVGPNGPAMMPAALPTSSDYTHAFEIGADEAIAAGASSVQFTKPLIYYVDNFLHFPAGTTVPLGSYDRAHHAWQIEKSGMVLDVVGVSGGVAQLNIDGVPGAESPAQLEAAGITAAEQSKLGQLYTTGQSLWRVALPHFSPWDTNWLAQFPNTQPPLPPQNRDDNDNISNSNDNNNNQCLQSGGSTVECQNQTLHEELPIGGAPYSLNYASDRVRGRVGKFSATIPLSGAQVPTTPIPLLEIDVDISVAGRSFHQTFPPDPNQSYVFQWDGLDAFGRALQGVQTANITVSYMYPRNYVGGTFEFEDYPGEGKAEPIGPARTDAAVTRTWTALIGGWSEAQGSDGLGGWSLNVHHSYDITNQILVMGDGSSTRANALPPVLERLAPTLDTNAQHDIAVAPDGSVYVDLMTGSAVAKIVNGAPVIVAGGNGLTQGPTGTGDDGPALAATFAGIAALAVDADGNLLILDTEALRKVDQNGIISRVAGNGETCPFVAGCPTDVPAVSSPLDPTDGADSIAVHDGKIYIAEEFGIRAIGPDGIIRLVAGGNGQPAFCYQLADGTNARDAFIRPGQIAFDGLGNLYFTNDSSIEQIRKDGTIYRVAGCGTVCTSDGLARGPAPDCNTVLLGQPAVQSSLFIEGLTAAPDGTVYFGVDHLLAKVTPEGLLQPVLTTATDFPDLKLGPDDFYLPTGVSTSGGTTYSPSRLSPAMPGLDVGSVIVPSSDGREAYVFDSTGRHLETRDAITGARLLQFGYDSHGFLQSINDPFGNITQVERAADGSASAIVGPYGQRTELSLDSNGFLASVQDPAGNAAQLEYAPGGLLNNITDVRGFSSSMVYDTLGRIITDIDAAGSVKGITRTETPDGWTTTVQNSDTGATTFEIHNQSDGSQLRKNTFADGSSVTDQIDASGGSTTTLADGTVISHALSPDQRFGMSAPLINETMTLPSGLARQVV